MATHEQILRVCCGNLELNKENAVFVRDLCKNYNGGTPILRGYSMTVKQGEIYTLLGSSGCGKTTALSCVVGILEWNSGEVLVFGKNPSGRTEKRLGYMPQDIALYQHLSIREICQIFGCLYSIPNAQLKKKLDFLNTLLKLPDNSKLIKKLSGGQKRRVSLAVSMLHGPDLLILDEPTVGLDPLLRQKIWSYLENIVQAFKTSIIITTHYIEEARRANTIGVMRNGRLIAECAPDILLSIHNSNMLENVILQLCRKDETASKNRSSIQNSQDRTLPSTKTNGQLVRANDIESKNNTGQSKTPENTWYSKHLENEYKVKSTGLWKSWRRIYGFTAAMGLTFMRFPAFLIFLLFMPTIQGTITLLTLGSKMSNIHFGIVNHELPNWSQACDFGNYTEKHCNLRAFSCQYLDALKNGEIFILEPYDSVEHAVAEVERGNIWGYLTFPENYTQHIFDRAVAQHFAFNDSIYGSHVNIQLDQSQSVASYFMLKELYTKFLDYTQQLAKSCDIISVDTDIPLIYRKPVYGDTTDESTTFIMPGVMISSIMLIVASLTALMFVADYKQGTAMRLRVAGLHTSDFIISHLIIQTVVTVGQVFIWTMVIRFGFGLEVKGPTSAYILMSFLTGIFSASLGIVTGIICRDELAVFVVNTFLTTPFLFFGGVLLPTQNMSKFWQCFGIIIVPTRLSTDAMKSIIIRGLGWTHWLVWPGIVAMSIWIVILIIGSAYLYRKLWK